MPLQEKADPMKCPTCGAETSGNYCSSCGNALKAAKCPSCGAATPPESRFCTNCGKPIPGSSKRSGGRRPGVPPGPVPGERAPGGLSGGNLGWWVAGALLVVVLVALGYPILTRSGGGSSGGGSVPMGTSGGGAGLVDLTTMSLEEQATLLFNRVMTSNSTGDTADVAFFLPKALVIYEELNPTDPDGIYHYALLQMVGRDPEAALAKAREGLAQVPEYLLLLAVSAEAELAMGDSAAAGDFYRRLLSSYDAEMATMRPGYDHHERILPTYREEAESFLQGG